MVNEKKILKAIASWRRANYQKSSSRHFHIESHSLSIMFPRASALAKCMATVHRRGLLTSGAQSLVSKPVSEGDPEMFDILQQERHRQKHSITLIPSENFTSKAVMDLLGSELQNKYSEGYPGERYYGGNEIIDKSESLCQARALELYGLDPAKWELMFNH